MAAVAVNAGCGGGHVESWTMGDGMVEVEVARP